MNANEMFKELVAADVLNFGGGNCGSGTSCCVGLAYSETFARCWSGVVTVDSYEDLKELHNWWVKYGREGCVVWMSKKLGYKPLKYLLQHYKEHGKFD